MTERKRGINISKNRKKIRERERGASDYIYIYIYNKEEGKCENMKIRREREIMYIKKNTILRRNVLTYK